MKSFNDTSLYFVLASRSLNELKYAECIYFINMCKDQLIKAFEALREENVNNKNWDEYYASTYAMENTIEDMCETYAFYMSDNKYRNNLDKHPILKKKNELTEVGGVEYLTEIVNFVPTASNIDYYIKPSVEGFHLFSFTQEAVDSLITNGYIAANAIRKELDRVGIVG